jgi:hypothetical protein
MFEVWFARVVCVPGVGYSESPMPSIQCHSHVVNALDDSGVGWGGLRLWETGTAAKRAERSAARDIPLLCNNFIAYSTNESAKQDAVVLSPTLWISKFRNLEFWTAGCDGFSSTHSHSPAAPDLVTASEAKCSAHLP